MAVDFADIIGRRFPGAIAEMGNTRDYDTLVWFPENIIPKPTREELEALRAGVEADFAADRIKKRQQGKAFDSPDAVLVVVEILAATVADIQAKLRPASLTSPLTPGLVTAVNTLRTKLTQARS